MLVDTGFLVALYIRREKLHLQAVDFLRRNQQPLLTIAPVIVETCYFLDAQGKIALLQWIMRGGIQVVELPHAAYADMESIIAKYADRDIDFTDAALIWLANEFQKKHILTVDKTDFSVYSLDNKHRFILTEWYEPP